MGQIVLDLFDPDQAEKSNISKLEVSNNYKFIFLS